MGGVGSTVQFEKAPPELFSISGVPGTSEKRDEGPSVPASASSMKRRSPMSLWLTQDGDKTLDAVIQALLLWGNSTQQVEAPETPCPSSSLGCLLEHHQLLVAWRMCRIGAPGRCGCCESLLPLGGSIKGAPGTRDASDKGFTRPCSSSSSSSSTNLHNSSTSGDTSPRRGGKGTLERSSWRRIVGAGAPQPDPSSCYLVIHAYTADQQQQPQQQQQAMRHVSERPPDRGRSMTPPKVQIPTGTPGPNAGSTQTAQSNANSNGSSSLRAAAALLSEDLAHLLTQAETRIAADTRRHSVWHAVHVCACCSHSPQQHQQQHVRRGDVGSRTGFQESNEVPSTGSGNNPGGHQQQQQQQHLWAVYLWEGLEAPRYILDHARLRTLRLVEALESCEQRGVPISPVTLLPWASFAAICPQQGGLSCWPTVEACERGDGSGSPQEQKPVHLDGGALLERNVLLLRLLLRLPRLTYGVSPSIPTVSRTGVAASELAAEPESAAPATATTTTAAAAAAIQTTTAAAAVAIGVPASQREEAVEASPERAVQKDQLQRQQLEKQQTRQEQQEQEQPRESRPAHIAPFVPRLTLPIKLLPHLQLQPLGSSPKLEGSIPLSGRSSSRRGPPNNESPRRHAADFPGTENSSSPSPCPVSPASSSGEMTPSAGPGRGQQQHGAPSGPLRLGGIRLQGVPKLSIPRLGGCGEKHPCAAAAAVGAETAEVCLSPQTGGRRSLSTIVLQKEGERLNSQRSYPASAVPRAGDGRDSSSSRDLAAAAPSPNQQQQTVSAGARLSGVPARSPGRLHPSGLLFSPAASPEGLQCHSSEGSKAGSFRESFGSRRRRTEEEGMGLYSRTRQQQLVNFRSVISDVYESRLFVSGAAAACNLECLQRAGITHVVNTIGDICPNVFANILTYKTYYLKDTRQQDIMCVFYDCIRFISEAIGECGEAVAAAHATAGGAGSPYTDGAGRPTGCNRNSKHSDCSSSSGGRNSKACHRVLIHCKEGVSRSATLAIAFLMWRLRLPFAEAFERMRSRRAICSPNTGFTFQLLLLQKRLGLRNPRASILNVDLDASKDGQEALRTPPSMGELLSETPSSPRSNRHCTTPGKGTKRAGSPLEGLTSPVVHPASGTPTPRAIGPRLPTSSIVALELSTAARLAEKTRVAGSTLEVDEPGTPVRGLGPRAPRICAPPRPGGDRGEGSDMPPKGDGPCSSISSTAALPLAPLPASPAAPVTVAAAAAGASSVVEDCVLLLHLVVHSAYSPNFLLWSEMTEWQPGVLPVISERGAYMLRGGGQAWVWMDSSKCLRTTAEVQEATRNYQENVGLVERRHIELHYISPGSEPSAFWLTLGIREGTAHLGTPDILSGLEPMAPEKSEEPFRWRDYCAFDLPADLGEAGVSEGAFITAGTHQDSPATHRPNVLEGVAEWQARSCEIASGQPHSNRNMSSRVSSGAPSLRRSFELCGNPADGISAQAPPTESAKSAAKLFCLPDLGEPLVLFDSEDLLPDKIFLLVTEGNEIRGTGATDAAVFSSSTAAVTAAVTAWLWVGAKAAFSPEKDLEAVKAQVIQAFNLQPGQLQLSLEREGDESETFWSHFANG